MYDFKFLLWQNKIQYKKFERYYYCIKKNIFRFRFNKWIYVHQFYGFKLWEKIHIMRIFLEIEMHIGMDLNLRVLTCGRIWF